MIIIKSKREIKLLREAGKLTAVALEEVKKAVRPGITTAELDRIAEEAITSRGGIPAFKGYHGFPASICTSINEEVVHGIPGLKTLKEGDIVSIDLGVILNGFVGDAAVTLPVGEVDEVARKLIETTERALYAGIEQARVGNRLSDISHAIQTTVEKEGFSVVRNYVGHGIGRDMHEDPQIPNFGDPGRGPWLRAGMTFAIEPMVNVGDYQVKVCDDGWTVVTADNSLSGHFEHTIAVTDDGPEILTIL